MTVNTKDTIIKKTAKLYAIAGEDGISMRTLAHEVPISASVLYHYFPNKEVLLKSMFDSLNTELGKKRAKLSETPLEKPHEH